MLTGKMMLLITSDTLLRKMGYVTCREIRSTRITKSDPVLIALVAIFEIGSIVSATAPTSRALIVGRVITGVGGAGITSGALILINSLVPLKSRPKYLG